MHVLFLIPSLRGGGAERVIATLSRHLDRSRFKVSLAVIDARDAIFLNDVPEDVEFFDLGAQRVRFALPRIVQLIWRLRPTIIFSTLGHLNIALAMLRPVLPRRSAYIARETIVVSKGLQRYARPWLWRWMYKLYRYHDRVVCQSQDMLDDLIANSIVPSTQAVVIHNPIDVDRVRYLSTKGKADAGGEHRYRHEVELVAAGRLVNQKGLDIAIEAMELLPGLDVRLTILGEGPLRGSLEKLAEDCGVADRVIFVGFQANPYAWFAGADAFILSSRFEGMPNVVLEALACGTPVIATPAPGGVREILSHISGCVLADAITARSLADAISRWASGGRKLVSSEVISPYTVSAIIKEYENLFDIVGGRS